MLKNLRIIAISTMLMLMISARASAYSWEQFHSNSLSTLENNVKITALLSAFMGGAALLSGTYNCKNLKKVEEHLERFNILEKKDHSKEERYEQRILSDKIKMRLQNFSITEDTIRSGFSELSETINENKRLNKGIAISGGIAGVGSIGFLTISSAIKFIKAAMNSEGHKGKRSKKTIEILKEIITEGMLPFSISAAQTVGILYFIMSSVRKKEVKSLISDLYRANELIKKEELDKTEIEEKKSIIRKIKIKIQNNTIDEEHILEAIKQLEVQKNIFKKSQIISGIIGFGATAVTFALISCTVISKIIAKHKSKLT